MSSYRAMFRKWTNHEIERVKIMRSEGMRVGAIARELKRTHESVKTKIKHLAIPRPTKPAKPRLRNRHEAPDPALGNHYVEKVIIPPEVLAERALRLSASRASLTAAICGDPPIGYSALERRS